MVSNMCFNSGKATHNTYNRSVYNRFNACNFIPNCAYEVEVCKLVLNNGLIFSLYKADNAQHMRAVLTKAGSGGTGFAGVLFTKDGEIVWQEVNPSDRHQGHAKLLRTLAGSAAQTHKLIKGQLYAIHLTTEGESSHAN
jgi:hypothetical protein